MFQFLESIKLLDGKFYRLLFHQQRLNLAFAQCYRTIKAPDLHTILQNSDYPRSGLYKCKILFDFKNYQIQFEPYYRREIKTLRLVETVITTRSYKLADRTEFQQMFEFRGSCDDVLLVRDGLITDTSYANVAFFDGKKWITPQTPLLYGVNRTSLLDDKKIFEAPVRKDDLMNFQSFCMFNAMIEFGEIELNMTAIKA